MAQMDSYDQIYALWTEWQEKACVQSGVSRSAVLRDILHIRGTSLSVQEMSFALGGRDTAETLDAARFTDRIVALLGGPALRLRHAFAAFDADAAGTIAKATVVPVIVAFGVDDEMAALLADEIDTDGDGRMSLSDFAAYLGDAVPIGGYRASHVPMHHIGAGTGRPTLAVAPVPETRAARVSGIPVHDADAGISPLDLRTGFFRLMQGAAYRSFRANWAANSETHLRARDLPYTIDDFARFTRATIDWYLSLGIITEPGCIAELRRLDTLLQDEVARLHARIANWPATDPSPAMQAAQAAITSERDGVASRRTLAHGVIEFVLALRLHGISPQDADSAAEDLAHHEINRLRHAELRSETVGTDAPPLQDHAGWIDSWTRVIPRRRPCGDGADSGDGVQDDAIDGAIMPVRFWYEEFLPQLVLCASIITDSDLADARDTTTEDLDRWHADLTAKGTFDSFATDLRDGFASCDVAVKRTLRQAWDLTGPYLNGVEKRRERAEFGRASGQLSEYVAFIDVHLGRHDVAASDMRLSFPYYIGPAVWGLLHGAAELTEALPDPSRNAAVGRFATFFRSFATMYPCPYCRYHLNRYVIRNRETDMYPLEFLLLGRDPDRHDTTVTLDDKLATIRAPGALRAFLWKLHNAVSSSIARTEPWYHTQPEPLYTSRFWPGLEAEVARAASLGRSGVAVETVSDLFRIVKPTAHLAVLRDTLGRALKTGDDAEIASVIDVADIAIAKLEAAMEETGWLSRKYGYDPDKDADVNTVDAELEGFARSGSFVER